MAEVLSQDEINRLLTAINAGCTEPEKAERVSASMRKIKIYDFKRPDKFTKEQIRAISIIHETFARLTSDSLSAQLRSMAHVHVASVDELTYEEFIRTIPTPTTMAVMDMNPLKGDAALEIDPAITFAIIDRICGGVGGTIDCRHELTDMETSIMEGVIVRMLDNLSEAWNPVWNPVLDLRPGLRRIETNPQFVQLIHPTDMVVLVTLEANIGDAEGMINICIPYITIEPIIEKLSFGWNETIQNNASPPDLDEVPVRLTAEVLRRDYPIKEILRWDVGTLIMPLRPLSPGYCYLRLGDRRVWQCQIQPDCKWFPKRITIVNLAEKPFGTEGNMEMDTLNPLVRDALSRAAMRISVELGATFKTVKEVYGIGEGTVVELDKLAGEPLDVLVNGILFARGEAVVIDENFGVRIIEILGNNDVSDQSGPQQPAPESTTKEST